MNRRRFFAAVGALITALCIVLPVASARAAERQALLVGIDQYPIIRDPQLQLHGAKTDLEQMDLVLQYCGFRTTVLNGSRATGAAIREALRTLSEKAGPQDEVVFYFSGRGSVAYDPKRPAVLRDLEPTLVPHNGQAQSAVADIPMGVIETWARDVTGRGAAPTIVLDACYRAPAPRPHEDRFYKNVPRCVRRPGMPRARLYNGPGVILAAADTGGLAFEWRVDFNADPDTSWAGAFTDLWTNAAIRRLREGPPPSYAEVMAEVQNFFAVRKGYMQGTRQYPGAEQMVASYRLPLFAQAVPGETAPPVPSPTPTIKAKVDAVVVKREEQAKTLRVALESSPPLTTAAARRSSTGSDLDALKPFSDYLGKRLEMVAILPQYGDRPDRIVTLKKSAQGWEARVQGDELDASREPQYKGKDADAVMKAGLADYLQRQAYALRIFYLADPEKQEKPGGDWRIRGDKATYRPGDRLIYEVETPRPGLLYILDRDEKDGIVQLVFPFRQDTDNRITVGLTRLPRSTEFGLQIPAGMAGRNHTRALLIAESPSLKLPALPGAADPSSYDKAERDHLRALVRALEQKKAGWTALDFGYEIMPK